jgi:hypothetical protein
LGSESSDHDELDSGNDNLLTTEEIPDSTGTGDVAIEHHGDMLKLAIENEDIEGLLFLLFAYQVSHQSWLC